jgi:hypothetical protein
MLHPRIDGVWMQRIAPFGGVSLVDSWPHGSESATWETEPGTTHPALRANAPVEIYDGGLVVWRGRLDEPDLDGTLSARGLWTYAQDVLALDSAGNATRIPDVAIDAAIARGALPGWQRRTSLSAVAWGSTTNDTGDMTLADLLDRWAAGAGKRWAVNAEGVVYAAADATAPSWHVPGAAAGRGLSLAEDDFVTHLVGRYLSAANVVSTYTVGDEAAAERWGRKEEIVDLTPMGVIGPVTAQAQVEGMMNLVGGRLHFAEGIELTPAQITTPGGGPAALTQIRAGQVVRLFGVADRRRPTAFAAHTDFVIGKVSLTESARTVTLTPVDAAARTISEILKIDPATEDTGARAMASEAADTATRAMGLAPISTTATWGYTATNLPNDGIVRTTHTASFGIPANARLAVVTVRVPMRTEANAAGGRAIYVSNGTGGWHGSNLIAHNQGQPAVDMGATATYVTDASVHLANGQSLQVVVNASNDVGSGAWTHVGVMHVSVTFLGYP